MLPSSGKNVKSIYPTKMNTILHLGSPALPLLRVYQIFCEKSTKNNDNSKGSSIHNSRICKHIVIVIDNGHLFYYFSQHLEKIIYKALSSAWYSAFCVALLIAIYFF